MWQLLRRELKALWQDPWQLALISYIPLLGVLALWWLFSAGVPRQLPVAVVDLDNSQLSRMLLRQLDASPSITPVDYQSLFDAKAAMQSSNAYAIVLLPRGLSRELITSNQPTIDIRYNGQYLLVGKLLSSQIQLALASGLKQKGLLKQLSHGVPMGQAKINLNLIETQLTPIYNASTNYLQFLLPPVLLAIVQILAMLVFANALNRELRLNTLAQWFSLGAYRVIVAKLLLFMPLLLLHGLVIFTLLYEYLGLPLAGDYWQLLLAQGVMLLAVWLIVLSIFFALQESARVISFCTALFAPAFAFMGVTYPAKEMPLLAQWWREIMPSSHYIDTHLAVASHDQSYSDVAAQLGSYWGFLLLLPVLALLIRRTGMQLSQTGMQLSQTGMQLSQTGMKVSQTGKGEVS
ncbi:ABC transporter permease [Shewanella sp. AS1]|uniref:ABC transporter permease n=1 Tax=Shewanella sp. AS1 TaxID=2907626 RepID=UPI001F42A6D5|nr:ABC transporter permease [Shewanella sp. AS1]MCE9679805.1 ABC transporter permease [Shewanella sp. AS1]